MGMYIYTSRGATATIKSQTSIFNRSRISPESIDLEMPKKCNGLLNEAETICLSWLLNRTYEISEGFSALIFFEHAKGLCVECIINRTYFLEGHKLVDSTIHGYIYRGSFNSAIYGSAIFSCPQQHTCNDVFSSMDRTTSKHLYTSRRKEWYTCSLKNREEPMVKSTWYLNWKTYKQSNHIWSYIVLFNSHRIQKTVFNCSSRQVASQLSIMHN